mgnify:FL=1
MTKIEFYLDCDNIYEIYNDYVLLYCISTKYIYKILYIKSESKPIIYRIENIKINLNKSCLDYEELKTLEDKKDIKIFLSYDLKEIIKYFMNFDEIYVYYSPIHKYYDKNIIVKLENLFIINYRYIIFSIVDYNSPNIYKILYNYINKSFNSYIISSGEKHYIKVLTKFNIDPKVHLLIKYFKNNDVKKLGISMFQFCEKIKDINQSYKNIYLEEQI